MRTESRQTSVQMRMVLLLKTKTSKNKNDNSYKPYHKVAAHVCVRIQ